MVCLIRMLLLATGSRSFHYITIICYASNYNSTQIFQQQILRYVVPQNMVPITSQDTWEPCSNESSTPVPIVPNIENRQKCPQPSEL